MSRYTLVSIEKCSPPAGQRGDNWHCYVISNTTSTIKGYRRGKLGEVRAVARECVMHLNSQMIGLPAGKFVRHFNPVADVEPLNVA